MNAPTQQSWGVATRIIGSEEAEILAFLAAAIALIWSNRPASCILGDCVCRDPPSSRAHIVPQPIGGPCTMRSHSGSLLH